MTLFLLIATQLFLYCQAGVISQKSPRWEDLECEPGYKYLFSDIQVPWEDARVECELYGGWLLSIGSQKEQNCLVSFGWAQGYSQWYWTDGISSTNKEYHKLIMNLFRKN